MSNSSINIKTANVQGNNLGGGVGVFANVNPSNTINLKSLDVTGTSIQLFQDADTIYISGSSGTGEVNSAINLGGGTDIFAGKSGINLQFKSLLAGSNITLSGGTNEVVISSTGGGGGGTGATAANNGLTLNGNTVILGGSLTGDTQVNLSGNGLLIGTGAATGSYSFAAGQIACSTSNASIAIGFNVCAANGQGALAWGNSTISCASYAMAGGIHSRALGAGSIAAGIGVSSGGKFLYACEGASFNLSRNTAAQTAGHGASGFNSAILGGRDHDITAGINNAAIVGGDAIKLTGTTYDNTTAVGCLAIFETPTGNTSNNNALVWNSSTKKIEINNTLGGGGGGGGVLYPNTLWVSNCGDDLTGAVGDPTKPFLTFNCARICANAQSPTADNRMLVCVGAGCYPNTTISTCNYVDWYLDRDVYICGSAQTLVFLNVDANLYGYGCFDLTAGNTGSAIQIAGVTGETIQFHCATKCGTNGGAVSLGSCSSIGCVNFQYACNGCTTGPLIFATDINGAAIDSFYAGCMRGDGGNVFRIDDTSGCNSQGYFRVGCIIATGSSGSGFYNSTAGDIRVQTDSIYARTTGILIGSNTGSMTWGGQVRSGVQSSGPSMQFLLTGNDTRIKGGSILQRVNGTDSIFAGSPQTVKINGHVVANCAVNGNVTTCIGTFTVDSGVSTIL